ncbi:hypothetical protein CC78DRAFT_471006, partial [Lojkania enalia]
RDNEYILSGYRPISNSFKRSIRTIPYVHNETANILSHLFSSFLFFTLPIPVYQALQLRYVTASIADIIVFSTFFFGVATCFLLSASFHIFHNHSKSIHILGNQLDYLSIVILMWGSTIPCIYYGFFYTPSLQKIYYTLVSILSTLCIYATLNTAFHRPKYRPYHTLIYSGLGLSFIILIIHGVVRFGWEI